jgi:hypothetical protein
MEKLVALDIDPRNGGDPSYELLRMLYDMPHTRRHVTWSQGSHILYRQPEGVQIGCPKNHGLGAGIDVKGLGGYLVAPGSTIKGKPYWVANPDREIAELPQDLVALCGHFTAKSESAGKRLVEEDDIAITLADHWLQLNAPEAVEGQRNNTAYQVAAKLYDFAVSRDTCRELLSEWSYLQCHPPMEDSDIDLVSRSAETNRAKAIGCSHPLAPGFEPGGEEIRIKEGGSSESGQTDKRGLFYADAAGASAVALTHSAEPLILGLIDCGTLSVVYGKPGSGKSFYELDKDYHIAAGKPYNGQRVKQGAVIYIAAEGGGGIYKRFAALQLKYGDLSGVPLYVIPCPVNLLRADADLPKLVAMVKEIETKCGYPARKITCDTLSRALAGGDESSSTDMGAFVRNCDRLREQTKAHLAVIHHTGKDVTRGARGWSGLLGAVDTEIEVTKSGGNHEAKVTKQRDDDDQTRSVFRLRRVVIGQNRWGNEVTSCVVDPTAGGGFEPMQMTKLDKDLYEKLLGRVIALAKGAGAEVYQYRFGKELVHDLMAEYPDLVGKTRKTEVTKVGVSDSTVDRRLSDLVTYKCVQKLDINQYVMIDPSLK